MSRSVSFCSEPIFSLVPCLCDFSWDFIYAEYVMAAGLNHRSIVWEVIKSSSYSKLSCFISLFVERNVRSCWFSDLSMNLEFLCSAFSHLYKTCDKYVILQVIFQFFSAIKVDETHERIHK